MCVGCGGSCGEGPRFTREPGPASMVVIGTNLGPAHQPIHLIRQGPDVVAYERLFTGLTPDGQAATYVHPGTFGRTFRSGRGR